MKKKKKLFKTKLFFGISIPLLIIAVVLYLLADRYLIDHVEKKVKDNPTIVASNDTVTGSFIDDWNYKSNLSEINIKKMEIGSGKEMITYYVADIKLYNKSNLLTAFANDEYGRNIVDKTSNIAAKKKAVLAINGDYYGFRDEGVVIRNGTLYRNSPIRKGFALFKNGKMASYDETKISAAELINNGVLNTFSFGPALVENSQLITEFHEAKVDKNFGNRTNLLARNPRAGIGMIAPNHYIFIVVDGRRYYYSVGIDLPGFAKLFSDLGCTEAYNLDGGGSATLYFKDRVVNRPLGNINRERSISDIIYVKG